MTENNRPIAEAFNVLNALLGIGLVLSPRLFEFTDQAALWHACVLGVAIAFVATGALVVFSAWEEWLNITLGLWGIAAPWALDFSHDIAATRAHVLIGVAVVVIAGVELRLGYRASKRVSYRRARAR